MGMFDDITCLAALPDEPVNDRNFQTKDLENLLDHYTITEDGKLLVDVFKLHVRTDAEKERYKQETGYKFAPPFRREEKGRVEIDYHGRIVFYGGDPWREYEAKFTDGRLVEIRVCGEEE
jgi:hypothetical protein